MLVLIKPVVKIIDSTTGYSVHLYPSENSLKDINRLAKSALRDIDVIKGRRSGRRWPRFENFANVADTDVKVTVEYTIEKV